MSSMLLSFLSLKPMAETRYTVLGEQGPFELRYYPKMVCAKVSVPGTYEEALKLGKKQLMDYISGNNFKVVHIKNYGELFQEHKVNFWDVGLILPADLVAPKPINRLVKIEEVLPGKVATLKFKGPVTPKIIERRGEDLKKWLNFKHLKVNGPLRVTLAESLFPISLFRTNEVQMDVEL